MAQQPSPKSGGKVSRRDFMKLMAAAGTVMTFAVFADWGKFLPPPKQQTGERQMLELLMAPRLMLILFQLIMQKLSSFLNLMIQY